MTVRRYGRRADWKRILKRNYQEMSVHSREFEGVISYLEMYEVTHPLDVNYPHQSIRIANNGYSWLQHFPLNKNHAVTTMFDDAGQVIQTYIDICLQNGGDENGPWWDDLYLDIIVFPTGEVLLQDEDELEEALSNGTISENDYRLAWKEVNLIRKALAKDTFSLLRLAQQHRQLLLSTSKDIDSN